MAESDLSGIKSLSELATHLSEHPEDFSKVGPQTKQDLAKSYPTLLRSLGSSAGGSEKGGGSILDMIASGLPVAGAMAGGLSGAPVGPGTALLGAGLGMSGGQMLADMLHPRPVAEEAKRALGAGISGVNNEMGGQVVSSLLEPILGGIRSATEAVRERLPSFGRAGVETTTLGQATGSPGIQKIEKVPLKFLFGGRSTAQAYEQQAQEAATFLTGMTGGKGAQNAAEAGETLRFPMRLAARQYLHAAAEPIRQAEAMIPEGTPVAMPTLKKAAEMVSGQTPLRPMTITNRLEDALSAGKTPLAIEFGSRGGSVTVTPETHAGGLEGFLQQWSSQLDPKVVDAVRRGMKGGDVSFQEARAIESELGDLARRQRGMGERPDRMLKALHQAAKQDVNAFASSDQAPKGFLSTLNDARMHYAKANQFLERGVDQSLRSSDPAGIVDKMFSPHQDAETLDFYREKLPAKQYNQALTVWLGSMFQSAKSGTENFIPSKFAAKLAPYIESGAIDHMMPPKTADALKNVYTRYREMPGLPSDTAGFMGMLEPVRIPLAAFSLLHGSMAGVSSAGAMIGGPLAIAKITTSPKVVDMLMQGIPTRAVTDNALRAAAQIIGGSIQRDDRADQPKTPSQAELPPISLGAP